MNLKARIIQIKEECREGYIETFKDGYRPVLGDEAANLLQVMGTRGYLYIVAPVGAENLSEYDQVHSYDCNIIEEGEELKPIRFRS